MFSEGSMIKKSRHGETNFELQITALIDTLVIILIFLLKSISIDSLEMEQGKNLTIPSVNQGMSTGKGAKLGLTRDALTWNNTVLANLQGFQLQNQDEALKKLSEAIAATAAQEKASNSFTGALLLEADKQTPFSLMHQALRVAKAQGYKDIRFVGARLN